MSQKSLIQILKSEGPKTDPWCKPDNTIKGEDSITEKRAYDLSVS
jgi:hypothetical protein